MHSASRNEKGTSKTASNDFPSTSRLRALGKRKNAYTGTRVEVEDVQVQRSRQQSRSLL